jgi:hypothetical protein
MSLAQEMHFWAIASFSLPNPASPSAYFTEHGLNKYLVDLCEKILWLAEPKKKSTAEHKRALKKESREVSSQMCTTNDGDERSQAIAKASIFTYSSLSTR